MKKNAEFYWAIVQGMDWLNNKDYTSIKREFMETYSTTIAEEFRDFVSDRWGELSSALDEANNRDNAHYGNYGGDDSHSDMLYHVVGMGKEYFNTILKNPKLLNKVNFVESFSYAIPYEDDYALLSPKAHKEFARRVVADIADTITNYDGDITSEDYIKLSDSLRRIMLILAGEFVEATKDITFEDDYSKFSDFDSGSINAGLANCIFDAKKYMG